MNAYTVTDGSSTFTRISKAQARKIFDSGVGSFYIIAHKMRPGFPFSMGMTIDCAHYATKNAEQVKYGLTVETFERVVNRFCHYNANCHETGTYAAFYLVSEK